MNRRKSGIVTLMVFLLMQLPAAGIGQEYLNGVCRIEDGRMIFRIDLNWTRDQIKQVSGLYDLDTLFLARILTGQADSLLLADGWQWKKISNRTAELSKIMAPTIPHIPGNLQPVPPQRLFLIDDKWMHVPGLSEPEQAAYGVNILSRTDVFAYSGSVALFFLPGYPDARQVFLSGTFNGWSTMQTPMKRSDKGWTIGLPLKPGKYAYKYIIDGRWTQDPNNKAKEDDLNGGYNSVAFCYNYQFQLAGHTDAKKVHVAGSFNGFNPKELLMNRVPGGWELPLFINPGTHAYKFVVDGSWITDPANPVVRPDGGGNFNSFIGIGDTTWFRLRDYEAVQSMILTGSFNAWNTAELMMTKTDGGWQLPYVLAPGNYEYKYIADGRWMTDTANPYLNGDGQFANSFLSVSPNYTFILDSFPNAGTVAVSGSFNGWNGSGYRLVRLNNRWVLPLYLKPGKYTYKLIIDGEWILDPGNELWEENEYGTGNSVLWIDK